jgi:tetratricopeptide (TPR) repeat protein
VTYTVNGQGMYPYEAFKYVLETGAGWNGTIGSADVIVRLPYEVNKANVWVESVSGYSEPTQGGALSGNEVRWHFDELEPTLEDNIEVIVVTPSLWESILKEAVTVEKNPNDGEAWGRLAKAYKEISRMPKGYLREDSAGREMFELSKSAYEKCLALLPKDSLWQYGYADLLWSHYYFDIYFMGKEDIQGILPTILLSLQTALVLDPNNQQAKDLLTEINYAIPDAVSLELDEGSFTLLGLTATPIPPTPYLIPTETPLPTLTEIPPTREVIATSTSSATSSQPIAKNPLCGSAFLLPVLLGIVFVLKKRE